MAGWSDDEELGQGRIHTDGNAIGLGYVECTITLEEQPAWSVLLRDLANSFTDEPASGAIRKRSGYVNLLSPSRRSHTEWLDNF